MAHQNSNINSKLPDEILLLILRDVLQGASTQAHSKISVLCVCDKWYRLGKPLFWEHILFRTPLQLTHTDSQEQFGILGSPQIRSLTLTFNGSLSKPQTDLTTVNDLVKLKLSQLESLSVSFPSLQQTSCSPRSTYSEGLITRSLVVLLQNLPSCRFLEIRLHARPDDRIPLVEMLRPKLQQLVCLRLECIEDELFRIANSIDKLEQLEEFSLISTLDEYRPASDSNLNAVNEERHKFCELGGRLHTAYVSGKFPKLKKGLLVSANVNNDCNAGQGARKVQGMRILARGDIITGHVVFCDMLPLDRKESIERRVWTVFCDKPRSSHSVQREIREITGLFSDILDSTEASTGASWQSNTNGTRLPLSYLRSKEGLELSLAKQNSDFVVTDLETEPFGTSDTAIWTILHNNLGVRLPRVIRVADLEPEQNN